VWLGAQAEALGLTGRVDEASMEALFGRCADPTDGSQLGRRMAVYRTVDERIADRLAGLGHPPSEEERARIEAEEQAKGTPQAVTGFDLTFSAPKSVSVLFALGDPATL
jgi:TrwC relaxase.